jgi:hypothetical protein
MSLDLRSAPAWLPLALLAEDDTGESEPPAGPWAPDLPQGDRPGGSGGRVAARRVPGGRGVDPAGSAGAARWDVVLVR